MVTKMVLRVLHYVLQATAVIMVDHLDQLFLRITFRREVRVTVVPI